MGRCLLVYDITHDGTRTKVADACLDYGLDRIQYSAFVGTLTRTHQQELMLKIKRLLRSHGGNVQLYPLCEKDWAEREVLDLQGKAGEPAPEPHTAPQSKPRRTGKRTAATVPADGDGPVLLDIDEPGGELPLPVKGALSA